MSMYSKWYSIPMYYHTFIVHRNMAVGGSISDMADTHHAQLSMGM
jgi:hypothetical protein